MKKKEKPQPESKMPHLIIGGVLVAAAIIGYWYYNSSRTPTGNSNRAANAANSNSRTSAANAPLGATPPNMIGSPTATVTIEEFADFQCAACAAVHPILKEVQSVYGNRIRFIFRNFPLGIPQHDKAYEAAVAVEAAGLQDRNKFWDMQNQLFVNQQAWTNSPNYRQLWEDYARNIGLDVERFRNDMASRAAKERVDADLARGRGLSLDSTPTVLINGKNIPFQAMTIANLRQVIDAEIQNAAKPAADSNSNAANAAANSAAPANAQ